MREFLFEDIFQEGRYSDTIAGNQEGRNLNETSVVHFFKHFFLPAIPLRLIHNK